MPKENFVEEEIFVRFLMEFLCIPFPFLAPHVQASASVRVLSRSCPTQFSFPWSQLQWTKMQCLKRCCGSGLHRNNGLCPLLMAFDLALLWWPFGKLKRDPANIWDANRKWWSLRKLSRNTRWRWQHCCYSFGKFKGPAPCFLYKTCTIMEDVSVFFRTIVLYVCVVALKFPMFPMKWWRCTILVEKTLNLKFGRGFFDVLRSFKRTRLPWMFADQYLHTFSNVDRFGKASLLIQGNFFLVTFLRLPVFLNKAGTSSALKVCVI